MISAMCTLVNHLVSEVTYPQMKSGKLLSILMDCLSVHQQDVDRCIIILELLVSVLFMSVKMGESVSERIVETAVFIMNNYMDSEKIQTLGIEMLEAYVSQEGNMVAFLELGGLDVVLHAMRGGSEVIRCSCCKLLVAAAKTPEVSHAIIELEGIQMILMVMKEHPKNAKLHEYAAAALAALAITSEICELILELNGLDLLFTSFKRFTTEEAVEASVTQILDQILHMIEDARAPFVKYAPIDILYKVMNAFMKSNAIVYNVCGIVSSLAKEIARKIGRNNDFLSLIDKCMDLHQTDSHTESHVIEAVGSLCIDSNCLSFLFKIVCKTLVYKLSSVSLGSSCLYIIRINKRLYR